MFKKKVTILFRKFYLVLLTKCEESNEGPIHVLSASNRKVTLLLLARYLYISLGAAKSYISGLSFAQVAVLAILISFLHMSLFNFHKYDGYSYEFVLFYIYMYVYMPCRENS